jgi:hypothetical protein
MVAGISAALIALAFVIPGFTGSGEYSEAEPTSWTPPPGAVAMPIGVAAAPIKDMPTCEGTVAVAEAPVPVPRAAKDGLESAERDFSSRPTVIPTAGDYPIVFTDAMTTALTNAFTTIKNQTPQLLPTMADSERLAMKRLAMERFLSSGVVPRPVFAVPAPAFATPKSM